MHLIVFKCSRRNRWVHLHLGYCKSVFVILFVLFLYYSTVYSIAMQSLAQ